MDAKTKAITQMTQDIGLPSSELGMSPSLGERAALPPFHYDDKNEVYNKLQV